MTEQRGIPQSFAALVLGGAAALGVLVTASDWTLFVSQLMALAMVLLVGGIASGISAVMASASIPMIAAVMIEAGVNDEPTWIRSLLIGCLWFVTLEMGWEALDRRDGSSRTRGTTARRIQEVASVVAGALGIGLLAAAATSLAPSRTVLLQAVVLALVVGVLLMLIRRVVPVSADDA